MFRSDWPSLSSEADKASREKCVKANLEFHSDYIGTENARSAVAFGHGAPHGFPNDH